ncbi:BUD13 homolog isoform X3 [Ochotona curzoniae]|uniref:BUD13 homolog isoform X3 n=1 Tax=Ochotona curzoniae TaxID=130825 RepID=UPI001B35094D|nr:BUD13 homolog isoform X3 [Ochotona curzoniae]
MAAAPPVSKAEYLKRYLSGPDAGVDGAPQSGRKRRKKRPKPSGAGGKGMRIVDDDVSWTAISTTNPEKEEEDDGDLPVVAEFVDERPEEVKQMEAFRSSAKWKLLGGHSEDLPSPGRSHHDTPDPSPPRRGRQDTPDPSPARAIRHDTPEPSPPRGIRHDTPDPSPPRKIRHDTPDPSPPRRIRHDSPDPSPPRRVRHDSPDPSPPRRVRHDSPDPSPPRRVRHDSPDPSPPRRVQRDSPRRSRPGSAETSFPGRAHSSSRRARDSSPDTCQPRMTLNSSDTGQLRRARHDSPSSAPDVTHSVSKTKSNKAPETAPSKISHSSLPKKSKYDCDSELSPPHKKKAKSHFGDKKQLDSKGTCQEAPDSDLSPPRRKQNPRPQNSDSDLSPPRNRPQRRSSDSDLSPPRRKRQTRSPDSDLSPPRRKRQTRSPDSDLSPPRRKRQTKSPDSDLSPPRRSQSSGKRAAHMYSGAKTGLVLNNVKQEQQELKKQDQESMEFEAQFQFAETVFRDKLGRKRNLKLERLEERRKAEKDMERDELYARWGKGLAQGRQQEQNVEDAIKEMQKPLARYIDDEDLDRMLREQEREGDPMANFIKKSKAKENKNKKVRPRYSGPAPPPNRFNIWPGYRWDGVDRSNGFEQKRFARLASKKAVEELAYKWSVEDM